MHNSMPFYIALPSHLSGRPVSWLDGSVQKTRPTGGTLCPSKM